MVLACDCDNMRIGDGEFKQAPPNHLQQRFRAVILGLSPRELGMLTLERFQAFRIAAVFRNLDLAANQVFHAPRCFSPKTVDDLHIHLLVRRTEA